MAFTLDNYTNRLKSSQTPLSPLSKPQNTVQSANPAAIPATPAPAMSVPKNPAITTPAAQQFIQNQGLTKEQTLGNLSSAGYSTTPTNTSASQNGNNDQAYLRYLTGMTAQVPDAKNAYFDNIKKSREEESKVAGELANLNSQAFENQFESREAQEARSRESGGTVAGAKQAVGALANNSNLDMARLAVRQNATANTLQALQGRSALASKPIQLGKDYYDPTSGQKLYSDELAKPASVQEYEYAKQNGYKGSFSDYQNEDVNRKAVATGTGSLTPAQINTTVNQIAGAFDNEPTIKDYNTIKRNVETYKSLGNSATDDIQRVYTFAKVADPGSAVKEGEYNSIEKYAQAVLGRIGLKVNRIFTPTGILTPEARLAMEKTLQSSLNSSEKAYKNVKSEYQRQINDAYSGKPRQITDYGTSEPSKPADEEQQLKDLGYSEEQIKVLKSK